MAALIVFGATGGIGSAVVRGESGDQVISARGEDRLAALAAEVGGLPVPGDVRVPADVERVFQTAQERFGKVDRVVLAVGSILLKPVHRTTDAEWAEVIALNLTSAFHVVRAATRFIVDSGGSIVLCSTAAAHIGLANHEAIAAAKAGVEGLARAAAATYASKGIRVNVVAPGLVDTPLSAKITGHPASLEASRAMHPLGRIGTPEDVAAAIRYLLGPQASWITGQTWVIDGGLSGIKR